MNWGPKFFPMQPNAAGKLIITVEQAYGSAAALDIAGRLRRLLAEAGLPTVGLAESQQAAAAERCAVNTAAATTAGVFGAPSFVIEGEVF